MLLWVTPLLVSVAGQPTLAVEELATETLQLSAGWNMVWLNLDPVPNATAKVLQGIDFQAIWTFQPSSGRLALDDPAPPGRWFFYDKDLPDPVNNLRFLQGQRGYLIKMNASDRLMVSGRPTLRTREFHSHVSNLFGALTNPLSLGRLTFERFFAHPTAQGKIRSSSQPAGPEIFTMVNGGFEPRLLSDEIRENTAYWVNMVQAFEYRGPVDVAIGLEGLNFGRSTPSRTITVEVPVAAQDESLTVRALPCAHVGGVPTCSGQNDISWLQYRDPAQPPTKADWSPLMFGAFLDIPAGESSASLEVRAHRDSVTETAAAGTGDGSFEAVIEIGDNNGTRVLLPSGVEIRPVFGRWIGRAALTKVSTHPELQELTLEEAEAVPLGVTLIMDLPDPVENAGTTAFRLLDSVEVPSHRDGTDFTQRLHAILFPAPVDLTEDQGEPLDIFGVSGTLTGTIQLPADDPLNPYRHRYNPEHRVGYDITRSITLEFQRETDSLVDELFGLDGTFGPNKLTGTYTEVITGVSLDPITVQGPFRLQRLTEPEEAQTPGL